MIKYLVLLFLVSCATPRIITSRKSKPQIQTRQQKIMACFKLLTRLGAEQEYAGKFCNEIYAKKETSND